MDVCIIVAATVAGTNTSIVVPSDIHVPRSFRAFYLLFS